MLIGVVDKMVKIKRFKVVNKRGTEGSIFASSFKEAKNLGRRHGFKFSQISIPKKKKR